ncbi:MAG: Uma2 family endonuclease [Chloroflexi bacterium]|nr:Uma2 family endonuclease [Chloroflexota bacterium]
MLETTLTHEVIAGKTPRPTYEEYLALPNEGQLVEWVDGEVVYHMPPLTSHQRIALYLAHLIQSFVAFRKLGEVFIAPFEVKCRPGGNSREPDVLFVATANLSRLSEQRLDGPADMIEVHRVSGVRRAGVLDRGPASPPPAGPVLPARRIRRAGLCRPARRRLPLENPPRLLAEHRLAVGAARPTVDLWRDRRPYVANPGRAGARLELAGLADQAAPPQVV